MGSPQIGLEQQQQQLGPWDTCPTFLPQGLLLLSVLSLLFLLFRYIGRNH